MAIPITNNNPQNVVRGTDSPVLTGNNKASPQDTQRLVSRQESVHPAAGGSDDNDVTVSRAAQILSQQAGLRSEGVIKSADQAAQLAKELGALFRTNNGQAQAAQAGNVSPDLMELLKAG